VFVGVGEISDSEEEVVEELEDLSADDIRASFTFIDKLNLILS
jgi:hypothetical protein